MKKRKKRFVTWLLAVVLGFSLFALPSNTVLAKGNSFLVVATSEAEGKQLQALLSAGRQSSDFLLERDYQKGSLSGYQGVVTNSKVPLEEARSKSIKLLLIGEAAASGIATRTESNVAVSLEYQGHKEAAQFQQQITIISSAAEKSFGKLHLEKGSFPFAVFSAKEAYAPYWQKQGLGAIMMGELMHEFFGLNGGKMYLLLDEVYAFSDAYSICKTADILYENGLPFLIRVMPIYDNLDYPAFLRFEQVLRYVQSRNGTVVIHEPLVANNEYVRESLEERMKRFTDALEKGKVAYQPMQYAPYSLSLDSLEQIQSPGKNFGTFSIDTMIPIPWSDSEEAVEQTIQRINQKWLSIEDYKRNFTNQSYQYHETAIDDQYQYVEEERQQLVQQMAQGNNVLIIVVIVGLGVLLILILIGSKVYRRKFYH